MFLIFCFCRGNNVARAVLRQKQNILSPNQENIYKCASFYFFYESLIVKGEGSALIYFLYFVFAVGTMLPGQSSGKKTKYPIAKPKKHISALPSNFTNR